jgi:hypothetical protein
MNIFMTIREPQFGVLHASILSPIDDLHALTYNVSDKIFSESSGFYGSTPCLLELFARLI